MLTFLSKRVSREYSLSGYWSHAWFSLFSLGTIALSIAVLASCADKSQAYLKLFQLNTTEIAETFDSIPQNLTSTDSLRFDLLPEVYSIGLSGICRKKHGAVSCKREFPARFNITSYIAADLGKDEFAAAAEWDKVLHAKDVYRGPLVAQLSIALASLLIISILLNTALSIFAGLSESAFSRRIFAAALLDSFIQMTAVCIWYAIILYTLVDNDIVKENTDNEMHIWRQVGIASWLLFAAFFCRVFSHPNVLTVWLIITFCLVLLFIFCVLAILACFGCVLAASGDPPKEQWVWNDRLGRMELILL